MNLSTRNVLKGAEEARQQLPAILDAAAAGRTTIITRHGRAVAAVVPATAVKPGKPASLQALARCALAGQVWVEAPRRD